jgi:ribosomal protein S20
MRNFKIVFSFILVFGFISFNGNAQLLNRLGNAAKKSAKKTATRKAEEKVAKETEKATEKAIDKLFNKLDKKIDKKSKETNDVRESETNNNNESGSNSQVSDDAGELNNAPPPNIESSYHFSQKVVYKMSSADEKEGPSSMEYILWFPSDEKYMATQMGEISVKDENGKQQKGESMKVFTIMDNKNQAMVMIMEEQKMAQIIPMDGAIVDMAEAKIEDNAAEEKSGQSDVKKTGRTKKILGYSCDEYVSSSPDGDATFWLTEDRDLLNNTYSNFGDAFGENTNNYKLPNGAKGFMMEMHIKTKSPDKSERQEVVIEVTEIKKEKKDVNMSNYQVMNMGNGLRNLFRNHK